MRNLPTVTLSMKFFINIFGNTRAYLKDCATYNNKKSTKYEFFNKGFFEYGFNFTFHYP